MPTDTSPSVTEAPCKVCGYNGPGYYQTATHPCPGNKNFNALPVDETELVKRMAKEHAFARRSQHDMARDADHYWQNTSQETQAVEIKGATAALSIVRPHLSEVERLRAQLEEARGAAMEEAAQVAESYHFWQGSSDCACPHTREWIATAIRARISGRG